MESDEPIHLNPGVTTFLLDDEPLLFHEQTQRLYSLNATAAYLWAGLSMRAPLLEVAHSLAATFRAPYEQALADARAQIHEWRLMGLLDSPASTANRSGPRPDEAISDRPSFRPSAPPSFPCALKVGLPEANILLRATDADLASWIEPVVRHLRAEFSDPDIVIDVVRDEGRFLIIRNESIAGFCESIDSVGPIVGQELLYAAAERLTCLLVIHSAVLHNGRESLILAGPRGAGKTTLTGALLSEGAGYLSDEVALIDRASLAVLPLPVGLRVKEGAWPLLRPLFEEMAEAATFSLADGTRLKYLAPRPEALPHGLEKGLPARSLVFPKLVRGGGCALRPLKRTEALRLAQEGGYYPGETIDSLRMKEIIDWIRGVECYSLQVDELGEAVTLIKGLMA